MRTKTQSVFMNTSNSDCDIIILVETWLNSVRARVPVMYLGFG